MLRIAVAGFGIQWYPRWDVALQHTCVMRTSCGTLAECCEVLQVMYVVDFRGRPGKEPASLFEIDEDGVQISACTGRAHHDIDEFEVRVEPNS